MERHMESERKVYGNQACTGIYLLAPIPLALSFPIAVYHNIQNIYFHGQYRGGGG